jgi:chemotaxis methyl-accepting protein methylase/PAS domain-containing protein
MPDENQPKKTRINSRTQKSRAKLSHSSHEGQPVHSFPVVGIGCSAGGLEALEQFLSHVPFESGMAYIIIQHLDPDHEGVLPELLQRVTQMPVSQAQEKMVVRPNSVYIIPPNRDMTLSQGKLHLHKPAAPRGFRLPIDLFFRSLAEEMREQAIGVILSGMGTDGTLGLKAIKEKTGIVYVQDPGSAKFTGMPLSAIDAGLADLTAPAEELPQAILTYSRHAPLIRNPDTSITTKESSSLEKINVIIRTRTGHNFSHYKNSTLYRRIERRMGLNKIDSIAHYVQFLQENPQEVELLFRELLIGVTNFFRDAEVWDFLKQELLVRLKKHPNSTPIRAWVPGCSTGEEAYSLAIILHEVLDELIEHFNGLVPAIQIYATDLDPVAIEKARVGFFPQNIAVDVSQNRLVRYFIREEQGFRAGKEIRESIVFATQNVITDPPFTKLDILSCRNLLIYFSSDLQKKLIPLFHYTLNQDGILLLGNAESISGFSDMFIPLDTKYRIFARNDTLLPVHPVEFPISMPTISLLSSRKPIDHHTEDNLEDQVLQILIDQFTSPAVLVNETGDILYVSGKTGKYLEMPAGKANLNIFTMAKNPIRYELSSALTRVIREGGRVTINRLRIPLNGKDQMIDLTLQALSAPDILKNTILIVFTDLQTFDQKQSRQKPGDGELEAAIQDNRYLREELSTLREEMQTSQEELKSTNEELQSTNEELQSTNEELTTSKEEMQSLNEELQTVNAELQSRVDELSRANNDMKNLLNSTEIATIFLDNNLNVRRFTNQATTIIRLINTDIGRPLTDLVSNLEYPELIDNAKEVLNTLVFSEKMIHSNDGRWFTVKILPYRTLDNRIDGLVITFIDVTRAKEQEKQLSSRD